jgi:hypothetical protein
MRYNMHRCIPFGSAIKLLEINKPAHVPADRETKCNKKKSKQPTQNLLHKPQGLIKVVEPRGIDTIIIHLSRILKSTFYIDHL